MLDDPRTKARAFLESTSIISEFENVLNHLVYEKPDDLHGFLANHFMDLSKQPKIADLTLKQLFGPVGQPAVHIDFTIALRNRVEKHSGLTANVLSGKLNTIMIKQFKSLINSTELQAICNDIDLYDQPTIDESLSNFRSQHANEMTKLAALEIENSGVESASDNSAAKAPTPKRTTASPGAAKASAVPPPSKKGGGKDAAPIEIIPDPPEPKSFAGQLLITGISLSCLSVAAEMQQINLYRLVQLPSIKKLSMPLPIIPILQSGPVYPGKQSIIKYFMLIPTPAMIRNEEWINKLYNIIQCLRETISATKGTTLQSSYSTDNGCLVFPMDKPEQGFDILQTAVNSVCGTEEHCFDYAVQMGCYETFDYTRGRYEVASGVLKTPDELVDVYTEWINTYPRCIMLIDPFRYADKTALAYLCEKVSNRCYITSTDVRRYQFEESYDNDNKTVNCHLLSLDNGPTVTEFIQRVHSYHQANGHALGLFERENQEVTQVYLADLAVGLGFRFLKLPGILSLGGQTTSSILQRLSLIHDDIKMDEDTQFEWLNQHDFVHIRLPPELAEQERPSSPSTANAKNKDKKKRS